jgi:8-oxo-dGTP pyrophosphatase MutT (NUDIX family)
VVPYKGYPQNYNYKYKQSQNKAGIFFYDPKTERILLVQSRGFKWGSPKGSIELEDHNDIQACAIREVLEETGIEISKECLNGKQKCVIDRTTYYFVECDEMPISVQNSIENNDANGITWINIKCLRDMIGDNKMQINYHCKRLLKRFLNFNHEYN